MNVSSSTPVSAPRFSIYLFGSFESALDSKSVRFSTRKIESLLAFLVLHPEPQPREKLAALLWGDVSDEQARVSLRYALGQLRKTLGGDFLIADRETVQLNPRFPIWVDAREFQTAGRKLQVQLYRGDLLADFYDEWILPERERYRQWYLDALLELTQQYRATSDYARAIETAQRLLESDPANERAHQHLMFCFVAQGNRQAALNQYEQCVRALREELAVDPAPETTALYEWIKQTHNQFSSQEARITNLPIPLTSFIGREQEMAEIKGALRMRDAAAADAGGSWKMDEESTLELPAARTLFATRMLTLTGAGGSGKTRLAIQAATDLIDAYRDGVWWVELAALADGALVPRAVANALGVRESPEQPLLDSLANFIGEKEILLVLDNCEHLLDACSHLARALLAECPNLRILATSREALGFIGESVQGVTTLDFPDPNALSVTQMLMRYTAVRLFVERAAAVNSNFELNAENASAVAQICARLDGIPLAVELAAARAKELHVEEIAAHLKDRFNFLTRGNRGALPRQQTLRALFDWSYELLTEAERIVLRRLAVFAGGWALAAATFVCAGGGIEAPSVPDLLLSLQEKSLVTVDARRGYSRQRLLETVREYAREKLLGSDEADAVHDRHLAFFLQLVEEEEIDLERARRGPASAQLDEDLDNLRAAIRWSPGHQPEAGLRMMGALFGFWSQTGHIREGSEWAEQVLAASDAEVFAEAQEPPSLVRVGAEAKTLTSAGFLAFIQGDYDTARSRLEAAQIKANASADPRIQCNAMNYFGALKLQQGDSAAARALHEQSVKLSKQMADGWMLAYSLWFLGDALTNSDPIAARIKYEESVALFRQAGDRYFAALPMASLAHIAAQEGNYAQARTLLEECVAIQREEKHEYLTVIALDSLAEVMCYQGDYENAIPLCEEGLALSRTIANKSGIAWSLHNLGEAAAGQGDAERAKGLLKESLALYRELGQKRDAIRVIETLAEIAFAQERREEAGRLVGAADALRASLNMPREPHLRSAYVRNAADARAENWDKAAKEAFAAGRKLTLEQAIELALNI